MDFRRITISVAPFLLICGLIVIAGMQIKQPASAAAAGEPPPLPRNVELADEQDESEDGDDVRVVELNHAPDAVRATVAKLAAEKNIRKVTKETGEGVTVYQVVYVSEGKNRLAEISEQGDVFEINTELKVKALPEAVTRAIKLAFPTGTIREASSVQVFFYDVEVMVDGKPHQVKVTATGELYDMHEPNE